MNIVRTGSERKDQKACQNQAIRKALDLKNRSSTESEFRGGYI
jgi:hypothetical protein